MARQIIQSGPSAVSLRQQAFQDGIDRAVNLGSKMFEGIAQENRRQQAAKAAAKKEDTRLQERMADKETSRMSKLASQGVDVIGKDFKGKPTAEQTDFQRMSERVRAERDADAKRQRDKFNLLSRSTKAKEKSNQLKEQERQDKINQELETPVGIARTKQDAKDVKAGFEAKQDFDRMLTEMIDLRETQGGGEFLNREAVARGKQLSKDLLLKMKDMAKLGVLSKSDEDIINAIIPADPLEFRSPLEFVSGQDSVMSNLKKLKADASARFDAKVGTRIRGGLKGSEKFMAERGRPVVAKPITGTNSATASGANPEFKEGLRSVPKQDRDALKQQIMQQIQQLKGGQ